MNLDESGVFYASFNSSEGDSRYYIITKENDSYYFRSGNVKFSENERENSIFTIKKTPLEYRNFIYDLKEMTKDWLTEYRHQAFEDITWGIHLINEDISYTGTNSYPSNYDMVMEFIAEAFNENSNKKEYKEYNDNSEIMLELQNDKSDYIITLTNEDDNASIYFVNRNLIDELYFDDVIVSISQETYAKLFNQIREIVKNWNKEYKGEKNLFWDLSIKSNGEETNYLGAGNCPNTWNEFMDIIIEIERTFKYIKQNKEV